MYSFFITDFFLWLYVEMFGELKSYNFVSDLQLSKEVLELLSAMLQELLFYIW